MLDMEEPFHFQYRPRLVQRLNEDLILPFAQVLRVLFHGLWRKIRLLPEQPSQPSTPPSTPTLSPTTSPPCSPVIASEISSVAPQTPVPVPSLRSSYVGSQTSFLTPSVRFSAICADRLRGSLNPDGITQNGVLGPLRLTNPDPSAEASRLEDALIPTEIPGPCVAAPAGAATYLPVFAPERSLSLTVAAGLQELNPSTSRGDWAFLLSDDADDLDAPAEFSPRWSTLSTPDETPILERARLVSWVGYPSSMELPIPPVSSEDQDSQQPTIGIPSHRPASLASTIRTTVSTEWYGLPSLQSALGSSFDRTQFPRHLLRASLLSQDESHRKRLSLSTGLDLLEYQPIDPPIPPSLEISEDVQDDFPQDPDCDSLSALSVQSPSPPTTSSLSRRRVSREGGIFVNDETESLLALVARTGFFAQAVRMKHAKEERAGWV